VINLSQGRYLYTGQHKHGINTYTDIRTHDPSVRASEDSLCLRPRGHCDRPMYHNNTKQYTARNLYHEYIDTTSTNTRYDASLSVPPVELACAQRREYVRLLRDLRALKIELLRNGNDLSSSPLGHEGDIWGSGWIVPRFLHFGTSWRWVVSFTPRPLYPHTHCTGGWVSQITGRDDVEKRNILRVPGLEFPTLGRPARDQSPYRLRYPRPHNVTRSIEESVICKWQLFY
jgi:hypothetical protein